ncbi:uncharacterized protein LOC115233682 [Formica exsecta]|uniref:uncharacterized protein LOC115233682 n=1 Tax=Formica exsecta TaxID=72781 RepID=UPI00114163E1|nr:uncharacterized protein LOC115233682 [Formica exsecta]
MLQKLWEIKLDWDESVPIDVAIVWNKYKDQIKSLNNFIIPRQIIGEDVTGIQLHGFCDASETSLLGKLYKVTIKSIRNDLDKVFFWSDSTIVLHWLQTSPHKLKTFVANCVSQIQEKTEKGRWRHVPSQYNPADALSRGQLPHEFINNKIWQHGPSWLANDESTWPSNLIPTIEIPEQRQIVDLANVLDIDINLLTRFSSFNKMKRIIAYCLRFSAYFRSQKKVGEDLNTEELKEAEMRIIKLVQLSNFENELRNLNGNRILDKKSNMLTLNPYVDEIGILRVGGRLKHAELEFDQKHPILLPSNNHITELIIRETHVKLCHAGSQATLYAIRQKYWLLNGRNQVKGVIRKCIVCSH